MVADGDEVVSHVTQPIELGLLAELNRSRHLACILAVRVEALEMNNQVVG